jgi:excisionase family DNA binding protein
MSRTRAYAFGWHPDRPYDSERFPIAPDGQLSTTEAALMLGLSESSDVRQLVKAGRLPAFRDGNKLRLRYEDVARLQQTLATKHKHLWCPWPVTEGHICDVKVSITKLKTYASERSPRYIRVGGGRSSYQYKLILRPGDDPDQYLVSFQWCGRAAGLRKQAKDTSEARSGERGSISFTDLPRSDRWVPTGRSFHFPAWYRASIS